MVGLVGKEEVEMVMKPRTDKKEYRRVVLPNCLEVLLISDPETDKSAASMDISVGSYSDPKGLEGLAHFLEHMLFFASEKYPLEDDYSKYIADHGGSTNAYTSNENTNYYFDVNTDSFEEALDRFAQFFIKPLMSPDATMREIKAVDSEHQKNLLSDSWRMSQLQQHICAVDHPYHKFSTGNLDTLVVRPKEKGLDSRNELIKFYEENYSANLMHLVVYGKESLDQMQSLVEHVFPEIPNTDKRRFCYPGQPCMSEHLQILVKAVPIKEGHTLRIIWPVTPEIRHYKEAPCDYIGHLIGHEGEGSLFYILKKLGWANWLYGGEGDWTNEFSFFDVVIDLTDAGHEHMQDIVGLLFRYIMLIQKAGVKKWIFDELSAIRETKFHYQDNVDPIDHVVDVAPNMQYFPPKDWLVASYLPSTFNPSTIEMVLDELIPNNVRIFWESKKFEKHADMVEPWYGTAYSIEKITSSMIQQWMTDAPDELISLPKLNVFIPTDLSLKDVQDKSRYPILLRKSSYSRLWYKPDTMFALPKAYVSLDFNCPYTSYSPEAEVLTYLYTSLLMDYLNEYAYDGQIAGLYYGIYKTGRGFNVTVSGYNHKMRILLDKILERIADFQVKLDRFSVIKETVTKGYLNVKYLQPHEQAEYYCSLILEEHSWHWKDKLEILPSLGADDLENFVPLLLSKVFVECYVAGNMEPKEAESVVLHIEDMFFKGPRATCRALLPSEHLTNRILKLEKGSSYFYQIGVLNESEENSALVHYIQVHQDDVMLNVKLQLFCLIAKQPAFHQLRTVEQLGYITHLVQTNDSGIRGLQFIIQSTVKDPGQIKLRVDAFMKEFESKLYGMTNEEFKKNIDTLINMKLEKFKNLREESAFFLREIGNGTLKFDRKDAEIAALKCLTHEELRNFFDEHIKVDAPGGKTLTIQVYGRAHSSEFESSKSESIHPQSTRINDIFTFRRSQPLYGSFKGGLDHIKL